MRGRVVTRKRGVFARDVVRSSMLMFRAKQGVRAFNMLREGAMALGIAAILGAAVSLALAKIAPFTGEPFNGVTVNTSTPIARNVVENGSEGVLQLFVLLPTQGIILGIVVLIAIVLLIRMKSR